MTYRYKPLTDDDLSELHAAAHMADAAGFRLVQIEPESVVSMVEEIKDLRARIANQDNKETQ